MAGSSSPSCGQRATPGPAQAATLGPSRRSLRLYLVRRRFLRQIDFSEEHVRIPRNQTAELRMFPTRDQSRVEPLVFDCPTCTERDGVDTKLLMVELQTAPRLAWLHRGKSRPTLTLLRITRDQFHRIGADFTRSAPADVGRKFGPDRCDREIIRRSLVP